MVSRAELVYNYLSGQDFYAVADALFVLGNSSVGPIRKAAELYFIGYAPKIVFTSIGGTYGGNFIWDMPETEYYFKYLKRSEGIPEEDIVYARDGCDQTTNTLSEAKLAIPFMEKNGINPRKVILVSRAVHQRRALLTFRKQHPEITFFSCSDREPLTGEIVPRMLAEVERIRKYGANGDLQVEEIPREVLDACEVLRSNLKK